MKTALFLQSFTGTLIALACIGGSARAADCPTGDCIAHDISTQDVCTEESSGPTRDGRWVAGLSLEADQTIKGGNIVAFKLQWSTGAWSDWFVVGVNDIDWKYNTGNNTMRRAWSYFYDHNHKYIICRKK